MRQLNWVGGGVLLLMVIFFVLFLFVNAYTDRTLPQVSGTLKVSGLRGDVTVVRDEKGVPHIRSSNEEDLYYTQGFAQAQDRLFQMDLSRRQASGRLREAVGSRHFSRNGSNGSMKMIETKERENLSMGK